MDVIIPARNEGLRIGAIVHAFATHPLINQIIISVDADTTDDTAEMARLSGATSICRNRARGKGQCVMDALPLVMSPRVIFCDADLTGLTHDHISHLLHPLDGMLVGVPEFPTQSELAMTGQPQKWRMRLQSTWHMVSGERTVPTALARALPLHGYLMEAQLNQAIIDGKYSYDFCRLPGLRSPFILTDQRLTEMERDRQWGIDNGILPNGDRR